MAMRRRIKVGVNLSAAKRKPKSEPEKNEEKTLQIKAEVPQNEPASKQPEVQQTKVIPKTEISDSQPDDSTFKCPPRVDFNRSNSNTTTTNSEEFNESDFDDGAQVMKMDLQRGSASGLQMSPSKAQRQRIRPTPVFGQRRNSLIGLPPSPLSITSEDPTEPAASSPQKRERHYSGSQNCVVVPQSISSAHKAANYGTNRIRTESTCSVFSDSHTSSTTTSKSSRKIDDHHNSQRTQTRRDFEARFSKGVPPDKTNLKMCDLIYYNPVTNPMEQKPKIEEIKKETKEEHPDKDTDTDISTNNDKSALPVPQLKLNAKGELILDDKSLEIETTAEQEARKVLAKSSLIYLDENTGMNGFYKRQKRTRDWPPEETIRFYRCLQTIGTDFSMMCQLFPKRTRRDIKLKFKKEERSNGALINKALLHPNLFNIQELKDQFESEDRQREEKELQIEAKKQFQYKKVSIKTSKSARALKNADDIYNQELRELELKKAKKKRKIKISNKTNEKMETEKKEKPKRKRQQSKKIREQKMKISRLDENSQIRSLIKNEQEFLAEEQNIAPLDKTSLPMHTTDLEEIESRYTPYEPSMAMPVECESIGIFENDAIEYDHHSERFEYFNDSDQSQNADDNFGMDIAYTDDSRTLVNMDSGNVTFVKDFQTLNTNMDDQNVQAIDNGGGTHVVGSHFTTLSSLSLENEQNSSLFGLIECDDVIDADANVNATYCNLKTENISIPTKEQNFQFSNITKNLAKSSQEKFLPNAQFSVENCMQQNEEIVTNKMKHTIETSHQSRSSNSPSPEEEKCSPKTEHFSTREPIPESTESSLNDEGEIQKILESIANGTLVVVSTYNPTSPDENCNEIYMLDPNTGELEEEPLDLPEELIQSILSVMT